MKIEIWFDFTCPFSYIGIKKFKNALEIFPNKKDVRVVFRSYRIAPDINKTLDINAYEYLAKQRGIGYDEARKLHNFITVKFSKDGVRFDFENLKPTTSEKAHNVFKMIDDKCAQLAFLEYVYKAHFEEGKDISSLDVLVEIGEYVSLEKEDIIAVYNTDMYTIDIVRDCEEAETLGLNGVPAFVVDEKYFLMGSHSEEAYLEMLTDFYRKASTVTETSYCVDEFCD